MISGSARHSREEICVNLARASRFPDFALLSQGHAREDKSMAAHPFSFQDSNFARLKSLSLLLVVRLSSDKRNTAARKN